VRAVAHPQDPPGHLTAHKERMNGDRRHTGQARRTPPAAARAADPRRLIVGGIATTVAVAYTAVSLLAIAFMVVVARSTRGKAPEQATDLHRLRETEKTWFVIVVVLLAALLFATIFFTPYGRTAGSDAQQVEITAQQFAWVIPGKPIHANRQVAFQLTSKDVNHAFAVYTAAGELLFQVQVMPGRTQEYVYTFKKPGLYRVVCLEYCGVDHTLMQSDLKVVA
jgi:cytochrome c oxidase subunit 2